MRKVLTGLAGSVFLLIAFAAFASSGGMPENNSGQISAQQRQFLKETKELRKEKHDLRCELLEATRTANPDQQKIADLKKQIGVLREEIQAKATELGVKTGAWNCENSGGTCNQHKPLNCPGVTQGSTER